VSFPVPWPFLLAACGFLGTASQVALLRELLAASFGVELVYLGGLAAWLLGGAAGASWRRAAPRPGGEPLPPPVLPLLALALVLPASAAFLRGSRHLLGAAPGSYLPLPAQGATALLGLFPAAFLFALLFRRAAEGSSLAGTGEAGASYGRECAGASAGSALATVAIPLGAGNLSLILAVSALCAALAAFSVATPEPAAGDEPRGSSAAAPRRAVPLVAAAVALLLLSALPFVPALDRLSASLSQPGALSVEDTPYGRVVVAAEGGRAAFFEDDALAGDSESTDGEEFAHLAALQADTKGRVLLLGAAAARSAAPILAHSPASVTAVLPDRRAFRAVLPHLAPEERRALSSPAVRVVFDDPRRFLSRGAGPFDLLLVSAGEPLSAASNRYYTAEFFRECASRLSPRGIVAFRLPGSENFRSPLQGRRDGSVRSALAAAFPEVLVVPGATDTWIGGKGAVVRDGEELARRFADRRIAARLVSAPWLRYALSPERREEAEASAASFPSRPNRDGAPECFALTALLWAGRFAPSLAAFDGARLRLGAAAAAAVAAALFLLVPAAATRLRGATAAGRAAAFASGFSGMALSTILTLRFQSASGSLYGDLGLLLLAFMAGMAAGALAAPAPRRPFLRPLPLLCAFSLLCAAALPAELPPSLFRLLPTSAMLFAAAALCGSAFAGAARLAGSGSGTAAPSPFGPLYAADLLGALSGIAASLLLLPFLGYAAAALLCAAACAGAALAEAGRTRTQEVPAP
jgi:spermidine synthase